MISKNKIGAMEMSVGTIVTIVLLMSVLVLGIFLVQKIFKTGTSAIDEVDKQIQTQINQLFAEEGNKLVIFPSSREVSVKKGDAPKGFAFSVENKDVEQHDFNWEVSAQDVSSCGAVTLEQADSWLLPSEGSFPLGPGDSLTLAELVKFRIPETAPPCTIIYKLKVNSDEVPYDSGSVFVTIK